MLMSDARGAVLLLGAKLHRVLMLTLWMDSKCQVAPEGACIHPWVNPSKRSLLISEPFAELIEGLVTPVKQKNRPEFRSRLNNSRNRNALRINMLSLSSKRLSTVKITRLRTSYYYMRILELH